MNFCAISKLRYLVSVNLRFAGYVCKRVGKFTLSAIGGGILVLQVPNKDIFKKKFTFRTFFYKGRMPTAAS